MIPIDNIQVVIVPEAFQRESKHVIGVIFFALGADHIFPDNKWDDFVVIILGWWMEATLALFTGRERSTILHFMDGSFHVNLEVQTPEQWKLECVNGSTGKNEIQVVAIVDSNMLLREIANAAVITAKRCELMNWTSKDLNFLKTKIEQFHSLNILS